MEKGYFSNIKFFPHPLRDENINIGIIIFIPSTYNGKSLFMKMEKSSVLEKIKNIFPFTNYKQINELLIDLNTEIKLLNSNPEQKMNPIEELKRVFKKTIKISNQRAIMIDEIEEDLCDLYEQQVSYKNIKNDLEEKAKVLVRQEILKYHDKGQELLSLKMLNPERPKKHDFRLKIIDLQNVTAKEYIDVANVNQKPLQPSLYMKNFLNFGSKDNGKYSSNFDEFNERRKSTAYYEEILVN